MSRAGAMILDGLPAGLRPTVQVIDDWFTSRRLGLVFEARVGKGRLLVTSIDLDSDDLGANPVARQMRHSLLAYAASDELPALGRGLGRRHPHALRSLSPAAAIAGGRGGRVYHGGDVDSHLRSRS